MNNTSIKPLLLTIKIIYIALITGLLLFSGLVFFINELDLTLKLDFSDPLLIVTPVLAVISIPTGFIYSKSIWNKVDQGYTLAKKLTLFQTGLIIRIAFCEGVGLFSIIGFLMTANLSYTVIFLIAVIAILFNYPSPESIGVALNLNDFEIDSLKNIKYEQQGRL